MGCGGSGVIRIESVAGAATEDNKKEHEAPVGYNVGLERHMQLLHTVTWENVLSGRPLGEGGAQRHFLLHSLAYLLNFKREGLRGAEGRQWGICVVDPG